MRCIPVPGKTARGSKLGSIPGIVPSLVGDIKGCVFRTRCELARPECAGPIPHRKAGAEHDFLCIFENPEDEPVRHEVPA